MLELNGHKYSQKQFDEYKFRTMFRLKQSNDWREDNVVTVYTDNPNKEEVSKVIASRLSEKVISYEMEHWATKEQDELASKFIDETLKDWK